MTPALAVMNRIIPGYRNLTLPGFSLFSALWLVPIDKAAFPPTEMGRDDIFRHPCAPAKTTRERLGRARSGTKKGGYYRHLENPDSLITFPKDASLMQLFWRIFATALAVALASCGGEGVRSSAPAGLPEVAAVKKTNVTLRIRTPRKPHRVRRLRRPEYVSVATQSIAITAVNEVTGQTRTFNQNLTPASNPNCDPATMICKIILPLKDGRYTLSFATFDGLIASGQPTGNELSANQDIPLTVSTGRENTVTVSLQGIPTSIIIEPSATSTLGGSAANGYTRCQNAVRRNRPLLSSVRTQTVTSLSAPDRRRRH